MSRVSLVLTSLIERTILRYQEGGSEGERGNGELEQEDELRSLCEEEFQSSVRL